MTPILWVPVFMVAGTIGILVWAYFRARRAEEANRMGDALWPDPAKTAGGAVGKYGVKYYGFGDQVYSETYAYPPEPDHHTLEEYDAIARSEQGEQPMQAGRLP